MAWKTARCYIHVLAKARLQWGHADDGVENPGHFTTATTPIGLQWGHADDGVENGPPSNP
jgi:hypothetical protein